MHLSEELAESLKRIEAILDRLEAASERRLRQDQARGDIAAELRLMQDDRSRLAVELDQALARNEALANAQAEVSQRLQSVGTSLQTILARTEATVISSDEMSSVETPTLEALQVETLQVAASHGEAAHADTSPSERLVAPGGATPPERV
ncbi:DUF4164 domain-containing protein [Beijerinckia indica]|uniref:Uncharacterized protein n=1 Tax=Beijerinckia indica subsp. indica (strain ATCC 9039 / DSM 1715 / NCIMB 8712) TaxID=395963 RepID=B2IFC6_BEII9|nr:DUF4164 domain-containing protein [Beijerinckia indica]ACB97026.1 hypothetical protein Bind_3469 [Beijerinckia indica subsp. indica ATCC 9039]